MGPSKRIVPALGVIQILTWGSTFYFLAVFGPAIVADTGWPSEAVMGGLSIGLLTSGLAAKPVSRLINRQGGRVVVMRGVGFICAGLLGLAVSPNLHVYLLAWVIIGGGMAAALYEAAFSTLTQLFGADARRAITMLTLWGGFAATICWPLSALLIEGLGWRGACVAYAGLHMALTLPLARFGLPRPKSANAPKPIHSPQHSADHRVRLLMGAGVCLVFVFSTIAVHLISLLTAMGLTLTVAVSLAALIGPSQVAARVLEMAGGGRHSPLVTLSLSVGCILCGIIGLRLGIPIAVCLVLYGAGTGLWTIARGTVPLELFGAANYPAIMARLALPALIASATAPIIGARMLGSLGPDGTLTALAIIAVVPCFAATALVRLVR
jgi:MFS family permease